MRTTLQTVALMIAVALAGVLMTTLGPLLVLGVVSFDACRRLRPARIDMTRIYEHERAGRRLLEVDRACRASEQERRKKTQ